MDPVLEQWKSVYVAFDPEDPARKPEWRAERIYNTVEQIEAGLARPFGEKRYLLLGTVGTGKSTELHRLFGVQAKRGAVVLFDVNDHFQRAVGDPSALQHVQPWEVLFLIGLALVRAGRTSLAPGTEKTFTDAARALLDSGAKGKPVQLDVAKLAGTIAALAGGPIAGAVGEQVGGAIGKVAGTADWKLPIGVPGRASTRDQDDRVHSLLGSVNLMISDLRQAFDGITLLVDGLDRITEPATTRELFLESALLGSLECATVVTGPLVLQRKRLAAQVRRFEPKVLANLPVLDRTRPKEHGIGCDFFVELFTRRVKSIGVSEGCIPNASLRRLAYYSGGRSRDFVRLVRMTAERAADRALAVADDTSINAAIDERRRLLESGLNRHHLTLLEGIAHDPEHVLPDDDAVDELLDQHCLLPYPNESEWYFPHPLLTLHRLKIG